MTANPRKPSMPMLARLLAMLIAGATTAACFYFAFIWLAIRYGDAPEWMLILGMICATLVMIIVGRITKL